MNTTTILNQSKKSFTFVTPKLKQQGANIVLHDAGYFYAFSGKSLSGAIAIAPAPDHLPSGSFYNAAGLEIPAHAIDSKYSEYLIKKMADLVGILGEKGIGSKSIGLSQIKDLMLHVSKDETRPYLCAVYFDAENGAIVATNGHTLLKEACVFPPNFPNLLIAAEDLKAILKAPHKPSDSLEISVATSGKVLLSINNHHIATTSIDREYPRYQAVIPVHTENTLVYNTNLKTWIKDAIAAYKLAKVKPFSRSIKFDAATQTATAQHLDGFPVCPISMTGKEAELFVDPQYLIDSFMAGVGIGFNGVLNPMLQEVGGRTAVVMPRKY